MTGPTYPDGPAGLIARWEKRRGPMSLGPGERLGADDLAGLAAQLVPAPVELAATASRHAAKENELRGELQGQSALVLLNAILISHLRKRRFPSDAPALFQRLWVEQGAFLLDRLTTRWMISSAITFGDHGVTEDQRSLGREFGMMFSLMKLYEFERLFSGKAPDQTHPLRGRINAPLPMEMTPFSLASGGLDINLLAPLWKRAEGVAVLGPLACALLERLNHDPGTLFARINAMRTAKQAKRNKGKP